MSKKPLPPPLSAYQQDRPELDVRRVTEGLVRAVMTPTDELAAEFGEDDVLVRIKRNRERLEGCGRHMFRPVPHWRTGGLFARVRVTCLVCDGEMDAHDVLIYLAGFAHGSGRDYRTLAEGVFPRLVS